MNTDNNPQHACPAPTGETASSVQSINQLQDEVIDSDALIVKGIIALLIRVISGHTPQEILDADLYFIERIGLREHLSPTRSNGLLAMVKKVKAYALAFSMQP